MEKQICNSESPKERDKKKKIDSEFCSTRLDETTVWIDFPSRNDAQGNTERVGGCTIMGK